MASGDEIDIRDFESCARNTLGSRAVSAVVPPNLVDQFMKRSYSMVPRDDYALVDNLIVPIFEGRFGYNRKIR